MTTALLGLLAVLLIGSWVCCLLTVVASRQYRSASTPVLETVPPISILKPLCGPDDRLEENLRSFFKQDYPDYEILFAVHRTDDPAAALVEKVCREFPSGPKVQLVETGAPGVPNGKAHSLQHLVARAQHNILVMSDSDVYVPAGLLRSMAAEFQVPNVGVVTCPYRGVSGERLPSQLEAIGMNTEFLAGVLMARLMGGMDFALGPTLAARREVIERMGGFAQLGQYLAEDFIIGNRTPGLGYRVVLSSCIVEHRIGSQTLVPNLRHRLRWARSTRCSRPLGYWGQIFTNPLPLALLFWMAAPRLWPLLTITAGLRALAAWATAKRILNDPLTTRKWWLIPVQDLISFFTWILGFFGNTIEWRGRRYSLLKDGRLHFLNSTSEAGKQAGPAPRAPSVTFRRSDISPCKTGGEILRP